MRVRPLFPHLCRVIVLRLGSGGFLNLACGFVLAGGQSVDAMGCASSTTHESEDVVASGGRASKAVLDMSPKDSRKDVEDDAASMSRSISTKASTFTSAGSTSVTDFACLDSSWEYEKAPTFSVPGISVRRAPTRRLHEKHVQKLNTFLDDVQRQPHILEGMIDKRRGLGKHEASREELQESSREQSLVCL